MRNRRAMTYPGMASWAGAQGTLTCRLCQYWKSEGYYLHGGLKESHCAKARQLFGRSDVPRVPHGALACKYFEQNPLPPAPFKGEKHG